MQFMDAKTNFGSRILADMQLKSLEYLKKS